MKKNNETAIYVAYEDFESIDESVSEKFLLKAVLTSAMNEVDKEGDNAKDAIRYFLDPTNEYIFSFQSVCEHLSVSPKQILIATGLFHNPEFMYRYNRNSRSHKKQSEQKTH